MNFDIPITLAVSLVSIVFILYRLLIKVNEQHIAMLKDELSLRPKPEEELKEQQELYERKIARLQLQAENAEYDKSGLEEQVNKIKENIAETEHALRSKDSSLKSMSEVSNRNREYLMNNLRELEERSVFLEKEVRSKGSEYAALVEYVKRTYGENSLLDFHYGDNSSIQLKMKKSRNAEARYKKNV